MKRKGNKSEFIRNAALEAAARLEKGEYPFPLTKPLPEMTIGWGMSRTYYRKLFWRFFWIHSTSGRVEKEDFRFEATRLCGCLWWVNLKSWEDMRKESVGTYDRITVTPQTP